MSDITYEYIKAIAKLENDVKERDATIKQLKADVDHNVKRALEIAEQKDATIKQLQDKEILGDRRIVDLEHEKTVLRSETHDLGERLIATEEENQRLKSSMKTLLQAWQRGDSYEFYEDLIEKHKLIEP